MIEKKTKNSYNTIIKGNRHRVVDQYGKQEPSQTGQSTGKVFVMLVTYQINECQQCQEEHSERH